MLEIVKNVHLTIYCLGCDNLRVLWHVPRLVDFTLMINLYVDGDTRLLGCDDLFTTNAIRIIVEHVLFVVTRVLRRFKR